MNTLTPFVSHALYFADQYKYILLFVGTIIEGPFIMVASGFLLKLGLVSLFPLFVALALGDLIADIVWYYIGYFFLDSVMRRHGRFLSVTPERLARAKKLFNRYQTNILLISKVTLGFGMALGTLMVAGASHVPFRKYLLLNVIGEIILVMTLLILGYFFGNAYAKIAGGMKEAFLIAGGVVVLAGFYGFSSYVKSKLTA
jgi:membrane protein DedA with SNARE-associated domain